MTILAPAGLGLVILAGCSMAAGDPEPMPAMPPAGGEVGPVVVELFTSQGCSSCPPADRVLSELAADGALADRTVVPLAFHVDYWDDLGWADPFASPLWTERQRDYARALGTGRVYTPQLVIGGRAHVVGSQRTRVAAAIAVAAPPARLDASIVWSETAATISATAPAGGDAWVALYEDGITTAVARGENAGERLTNDHVVRRFERVATAGRHGTVEVALDPRWQGHRLGAVAIAQDADRAIIASRALPPR